jgi:ADP-heptose:LPS heptosyltransferase
MHPDRMRRIDFWIGIPLCFGLTVWRRLLDAFGLALPAPDQPTNVLFIELAEMGSTVLAAPALIRLQARHPGCRVFFLLFTQIQESVRVLGLVPEDRIFTIDARSVFTLVRDTIRFVALARRHRIDTVINLEMFSRFSSVLAYLSGASRRVGFHRFGQEGLYTGRLLTHEVAYSPHQHTWKAYMALVTALEEPAGTVPLGKRRIGEPDCIVPRFRTSPTARAALWNRLVALGPALEAATHVVLVNPNASSLIETRKWPIENYIDLVRELLRDPGVAVAITGVASERREAQRIVTAAHSDRVIDLTGHTTLEDLLHLFDLADLLVTNDSGPAHFAAMTDIPVLVLFGPETPVLYKPLSPNCTVLYAGLACSPCVSAFNQKRSPCRDNQCLKVIGVQEVYAAARRVLAGSGARRSRARVSGRVAGETTGTAAQVAGT